MSKAICYDEICGTQDKINFLSIVLGVLVVSTVILGAITINAAMIGFESVSIPLMSSDF